MNNCGPEAPTWTVKLDKLEIFLDLFIYIKTTN